MTVNETSKKLVRARAKFLCEYCIINISFNFQLIMTNITISNLDDDLKNQLQKRAEKHGHSLEQEITEILHLVLTENPQNPINLATLIETRFANFEDLELPEIERDAIFPESIFAN